MSAYNNHGSVTIRGRNNSWVPRPEEQAAENLYNERTFYPAFTKDLLSAKKEVIIYSPFVSKYRAELLSHIIVKLTKSNVDIFIFTRSVEEYDRFQQNQVRTILRRYEELGICIFYMQGSIHEKVAVIDREILWEGSLNILSQRSSKEMMRRTIGENAAMQVISYLGLPKKLAEGYKMRYVHLYRTLMAHQKRRYMLSRRTIILGCVIFLAGLLILILGLGVLNLKIPELTKRIINLLS